MIYKLATLVTLSLVIANANALPTGDMNELDTREPFEEEEHVSRSIGEASQLELSTRDVVEFEAREEGMEAREFEEEEHDREKDVHLGALKVHVEEHEKEIHHRPGHPLF